MDIKHFQQRFMLQQLTPLHNEILTPSKNILAAVLVPIIFTENGMELIFITRALHLKVHPGQVGFPGGKKEPEDKNLIETALRECQEEIGLAPSQVDIIGTLPSYDTATGYNITPSVGLIKSEFKPFLDKNEVQDLFSVPWSYLTQSKNKKYHHFLRAGLNKKVCFIPFYDKLIWGATTAIIEQLNDLVE